VRLWSGPPQESERTRADAERYAEWFQRNVALAHEHAWIPTGCHERGFAIACSNTVEQSLFHVSLPLLPDVELARTLALRLAHAGSGRRQEMMRDMNLSWEASPFTEVAEGRPLSREAFDVACASWLDAHPLWQ